MIDVKETKQKEISTQNVNIFEFSRIVVIGNNGSGKSFFAKNLSILTKLPVVHLDTEFWKPNWEMPTKEEWFEKMKGFTSNDQWIIDGICSHGDTLELRFKTADLIVFLDINRFVCLAGVIKRNGKERSDTAIYSYEKYDMRFIKLCKGILSFSKTRKKKIMDLHKKYFDKTFFIIKSRREMNKVLNQWKTNT